MLVCRDPVELTIIAKTQAIGDRFRLIAHALRLGPSGLAQGIRLDPLTGLP